MHLYLVEDVLSVGMPESGGADAGVGKMAAAQGSHAWPRPCPLWEVLGSTHVHRGAVSHCGVFKVSSYNISLP